MKELKVKEFEVRDGRVIAKFLIKTGLKKTLFDVMFPKDTSGKPKNWAELRKYLQEVHGFTDAEFREFQKRHDTNFDVALKVYEHEFPDTGMDMGQLIIEAVIDIFADDNKYEELVALFAYLFTVDRAIIEALSIKETVEMIKKLLNDTGFLALWQQSTPLTETAEETPIA